LSLVTVFDGGDLEGDLREGFGVRMTRSNSSAARAWLRRQVWRSLLALSVHAAYDALAAACRGLAALVAWYVSVYLLLRVAFSLDRPLSTMSFATFTVVWVFGGVLAAGYAATRGRYPSLIPATMVSVTAIIMLLIGVDERLGLGVQALWASVAVVGAFLGSGLATRTRPHAH
jgi:hypothetical protein